MTKELIEKINAPKGVFSSNDLSVDEKKVLYSIMLSYNATNGFTYDRFFKEGFDEWELKGINMVTDQFCKKNNIDKSDVPFFTLLDEYAGMKEKLYIEMGLMGMCRNTARKRFAADDWKAWERKGILSILEEMIEQ
jgi:hypothetical protein